MSKTKVILILGVLVAILPILGIPRSIKNILISIIGLLIIYLSYFLYKSLKKGKAKAKKIFENFSENKISSEKTEKTNNQKKEESINDNQKDA